MTILDALILSLPTRNSTVRMRVWRALKGAGCGVLRDGVYLLPHEASSRGAFPEIESQVRAAGGFAMTVDLGFRDSAQRDHARNLFDRSRDYGALVARIAAVRGSLARLGKRKAETAEQRFQRAFE